MSQQLVLPQLNAGVEPEQLDVEHVRERGQGMPVARVRAAERQLEALSAEPLLYDRVLAHVDAVVQAHVLVVRDLRVDQEYGAHQAQAQQQLGPARSRAAFAHSSHGAPATLHP